MPGPVIKDPTPAWMRPQNASVLDPMYVKVARALAHMAGLDDPQSQVLALATPLVPQGQETVGALGKVAGAIRKKITAYHGSPHDFDTFSTAKIGTGEGNQAYGRGLYFAEQPEVAREYQRNLSPMKTVVTNTPRPGAIEKSGWVEARQNINGDKQWYRVDDVGEWDVTPFASKADAEAALPTPSYTTTEPGGRLYEVEINADPEQLLDYDKPLNQQSAHVQGAVAKMREAGVVNDDFGLTQPTNTGGNFLRSKGVIAPEHNLRRFGVPGVKYLDGGSRNPSLANDRLQQLVERFGGDVNRAVEEMGRSVYLPPAQKAKWVADMVASYQPPTYNYVIFDDSLIKVLKKSGASLALIAALRAKAAQNGGRLERSDVAPHLTRLH